MATKKKGPAKKVGGSVQRGPKKGAPKKASFRAGKPSGGKPAGKKPGKQGPERKLPRKAGPRRKTPKSIGREAAIAAGAPASTAPDEARPRALLVAKAALEKKAEAVTVFDVRGLSSYADYLVLMTTDSNRQAAAVADAIDVAMKAAGHTKVAVEGYESGTWIIVDYGDVVAHVLGRDARTFWDLDGLWVDAPRFTVEG